MSYTNAILELRQMLSDTDQHKRSTRKKLIGNVDGSNLVFVTYDKRIVEDTFQAFVNGLPVQAVITDPVAGEVAFAVAPLQNSTVQASYYWQWWLDTELTTFLNKGAEAVGLSTTSATTDNAYLQVIPGLKSAVLQMAASMSAESLANYLITRKHSAEHLLEQDKGTDEGMPCV